MQPSGPPDGDFDGWENVNVASVASNAAVVEELSKLLRTHFAPAPRHPAKLIWAQKSLANFISYERSLENDTITIYWLAEDPACMQLPTQSSIALHRTLFIDVRL